jgi:hypothetical protein
MAKLGQVSTPRFPSWEIPNFNIQPFFLAQSNVQYAIAQVMMWLSLVTVGQKVTTCSGFHAVFRIAMAMGQ